MNTVCRIKQILIGFIIPGLLLTGLSATGQPSSESVRKEMTFKYQNSKKPGSMRTGTFELLVQTQSSPDGVGNLFSSFDLFHLDMNSINPANPGEGYFVVYLKNFKVNKKHKIIIRDSWITVPPICAKYGPHQDFEVPIESDRNDLRLKFKIKDNGSGEMDIFLDCIPVDSPITSALPNHNIRLKFEVTGFANPACEAWALAKNGKREDWCAFLQKYRNAPASCLAEAQHALQDLEQKEYNQLSTATGTPEERLPKIRKALSWYSYCTEYTGQYNGALAQLLRKLEQDSAKAHTVPISKDKEKQDKKTERVIPECEKEWSKISDSGDAEALRTFISTYGSSPECKNAVSKAQQRLELIEPLQFTVTQTGNSAQILVNNAARIHPRYLDISDTEGLEIVGTGFSNTGRLEVALKQPGIYKIYILDDQGRDTTIEVRNLFAADLKKADEGYQVIITGAESPYRISLIDLKTDSIVYAFRTSSDTVQIFKKLLELKGLLGEYSVQVSARSQEAPVVAQGGSIRLDKQSNSLRWVALIGGLILGAALVLYLLYSLWKARSTSANPITYRTS